MKNLIIPALALLVGASAIAPTAQAASGPVTKQELREYTQRSQRIRDAAQKCSTIRMERRCVRGKGENSSTILNPEQTEELRRIFSTGLQPFQGDHNRFITPGYLTGLWFLDENGKVLAYVREDEVAPAGAEHNAAMVRFTLPEKDYKLYRSIIGQ